MSPYSDHLFAADPDDALDRGLPETPQMSVAEFQAIADAETPFATMFGLRVEDIGRGTARFRLHYGDAVAAPNRSVTGAALFALADFALFGVVLSIVGRVPLAVTTSLNTNLVRRCPQGDVICEARLVRAGRRLVTAEAWMISDSAGYVVAQASGTYSVPPPESR